MQLPAVDRAPGLVEQRTEIQAEDVHHLDGGLLGTDGAQRLEVGLARLRGEMTNSRTPARLPGLGSVRS